MEGENENGFEQFRYADSEEVGLISEQISLVCPLSLKVIDTAFKGKDCEHLSAFDKASFEQVNKQKHNNIAKCPICSKEIPCGYLIADPSLQRVLDYIKLNKLDINRIDSKFLSKSTSLEKLKSGKESADVISLVGKDISPRPVAVRVKTEEKKKKNAGLQEQGCIAKTKIETVKKERGDEIVWKHIDIGFQRLGIVSNSRNQGDSDDGQDRSAHVALEDNIINLSTVNTHPRLSVFNPRLRWPPCTLLEHTTKWKQTMGGIEVHFPFKRPLTPQLQMMQKIITSLKEKQHALLESPTGTGKTAALLCSTLAWQRHHDVRGWRDFGGNPMRIIFCSRTHQQVKQASKALKSMSYRPVMTVAGSRKHLCLDKEVLTGVNLNGSCSLKVAMKSCQYYKTIKDKEYANTLYEELRPKFWRSGRSYESSVDHTDEPGGVIDIEDLKVLGRESQACPYYSSKALVSSSQLILCPYNYVLDPGIRQSVLGASSLENSVIVIDEAHNIETVLLDSGSTEIDLFQLMKIVQELCVLHSFLDWDISIEGQTRKMTDVAGELMVFVETIVQVLLQEREHFETKRGALEIKKMGKFQQQNKVVVQQYGGVIGGANNKKSQPPSSLLEKRKLVDELETARKVSHDDLTSEDLQERINTARAEAAVEEQAYQKILRDTSGTMRFFDRFNMHDEGNFDSIMNTYEFFRIGLEQERKRPNSERPTSSLSITDHLSKLLECLKLMRAHPFEYYAVVEAYLNHEEEVAPFHPPNEFNMHRFCCLDQVVQRYKHGKYLKGGPKDPPNWKIRLCIWLMTPAVMFESIAQRSHSVILTSGTIFPMSPWELGRSFVHRLSKNVAQLNHVVKRNQVFVSAVPTAPNGASLEGTFRNISNMKEGLYETLLGASILALLESVEKGGSIVFLPSYSKIKQCQYHWSQNGILKELTFRRGPVIFEPSGKKSKSDKGGKSVYVDLTFDEARDSFIEHIENNKSPIIVAVYRGKMSEGMDFKDNFCRAVFCVGIPFPSAKDNRIHFKKLWNNRIHKNENPAYPSGDTWYRQQAYRALNQALGRCIRHRFDYGCIFLLDSRFSQDVASSSGSGRPSPRTMIAKWAFKLLRNDTFGGFRELVAKVSAFFENIPDSVRHGEDLTGSSQSQSGQSVAFYSQFSTPSSQKRKVELEELANVDSPAKLAKKGDLFPDVVIL